MRLGLITVLAALAAVSAARADGPIATGGDAPPTPPPAAAPGPLPDDATVTDAQGRPVAMGPCGPTLAKADGSPDDAAHGEIEAGIGTGGYRHLAATVCKPIGDSGSAQISVGTTDWNGPTVRR